MIKKDCKICGKKFYILPYKKNVAKFCSHKCYWKWLKGKHPKSEFKKGQSPWNKDKKGIYSKETLEKMRKAVKNRLLISEETREKIRKANKGNKYAYIDGRNSNSEWKNFIHRKCTQRRRKLKPEGSHTLKDWQELKKKYNYTCLMCKKVEPEIKLTEDHIIPLSKEGSDYIENIQPLCRRCNATKHIKIIDLRDNFHAERLSEKTPKGDAIVCSLPIT